MCVLSPAVCVALGEGPDAADASRLPACCVGFPVEDDAESAVHADDASPLEWPF